MQLATLLVGTLRHKLLSSVSDLGPAEVTTKLEKTNQLLKRYIRILSNQVGNVECHHFLIAFQDVSQNHQGIEGRVKVSFSNGHSVEKAFELLGFGSGKKVNGEFSEFAGQSGMNVALT